MLSGFGVANLVVRVLGTTTQEITGKLQFPWDLDNDDDLESVHFYTLSGADCDIGGPAAKQNLLDKVQSFGPQLRAKLAAARNASAVLSRADHLEALDRELIKVWLFLQMTSDLLNLPIHLTPQEQAAYDALCKMHADGIAPASSSQLPLPSFPFGFQTGRGAVCNDLLPLTSARIENVLQLLSECGGGTLIYITEFLPRGTKKPRSRIFVLSETISISHDVAAKAGKGLVKVVLDWDLTKPGPPSALHLLRDDHILRTWNGHPQCVMQHKFTQLAGEREHFVRYVSLFHDEQRDVIEDRHNALFKGGARVSACADRISRAYT